MFFGFTTSTHHNAVFKIASNVIFNVVVIILSTNVLIAQNPIKENIKALSNPAFDKFEVGASGGLSLNSFTTSQPQTGFNTGAAAGLSINYKFFRGLGV